MWKDEAISRYITTIAETLVQGAPNEYERLEFIGIVIDGMSGTNARVWLKDGKKAGFTNFFDEAENLEAELKEFHSVFASHNENWKAMLLTISQDGDFDIQFEYDDPYRWDEYK